MAQAQHQTPAPAPDVQSVALVPVAEPAPTTFGDRAQDFLIDLALALLIFIVGKWISRWITAFVRRGMTRQKVEPTIVDFVGNLLYGFLVVIVLLMAGDRLGLPTTSLVAVVGASTLAVGMALRDSLANFAAGVLLVAFRYYRVRDNIEVAGAAGTVESIQIFSTVLTSPENNKTIVPNGNILKAPIKNLTAHPTARIEISFKVAYDSDVARVRALLLEVLQQENKTLEDPAPSIDLKSFGGGTLEFLVRVWVLNEDFWQVQTGLNEQIKAKLDAAGIVVK